MDGDEVFTFYSLPSLKQHNISELLGKFGAVLVEQHHYMTYKNTPPKASSCSILVTSDLKPLVDTQELLLITDILVSDYSGAFIDFSLLKRPCIHFAYDLNHYIKEDSGMAYDIRDVAAGPIVRNFSDLMEGIAEALGNRLFSPSRGCKELTAFEDGRACERLLTFVEEASV